jgi:hypothetical protein
MGFTEQKLLPTACLHAQFPALPPHSAFSHSVGDENGSVTIDNLSHRNIYLSQ